MNYLAARVVAMATSAQPPADDGKHPATVESGRRVGWTGGKARAATMTPAERREAAGKAAARWGTKNEPA
jgi:hypothetical protein